MSSPRNHDDGSDWQEPPHLSGDEPAGGDSGTEPNIADRRKQPRDSDHTAEGATWRPPGWDLPPAVPERNLPEWGRPQPGDPGQDRAPDTDPAWGPPDAPPPDAPEPSRGGLFGARRRPRDPEMARAFSYEGDQLGAQSWALQHGWSVSDGSGPEDAVLVDLLASAPIRPGKEARPAGVLRGRAGTVELVAFDVVYPRGRGLEATHAITAAPLLGAVPALRLSPARLWKHRIGGLVPVPTGNDAFDRRWQLLAAEDDPQVRRLAQDATVHALLLGTDDGDEFWTGAGHLAAVRPDGHRPQLIEHHARLLTALVGALTSGY